MARRRGGGAPNRMDLRRQAEAAEAREREDEETETDDEEQDEEAEEEESDSVEASDDDGGSDDGDEEEVKPKAKKAKVKKEAAAKTKRTRATKEVRMKAIWVVMDNGSKRVKEFAFNQKTEAETFLAEKIEEKKATFYLQLIKEPLE